MTNKNSTLVVLNALNSAMGFDVNLRVAMNFLDAISHVLVPDVVVDPAGVEVGYDLSTHNGRVAFAAQGVCAAFIKAGSKIQAIKALRDVANCGLIEAKDAIDEAARQYKANNPF